MACIVSSARAHPQLRHRLAHPTISARIDIIADSLQMNGRHSGVGSGLAQGGCGEAVPIRDEPVITSRGFGAARTSRRTRRELAVKTGGVTGNIIPRKLMTE